MAKYRKKPIVIEAAKFDGTDESIEWIPTPLKNREIDKKSQSLYIRTLEGVMKADIGDYIIQGVNGEFYPCKPTIFHKTYDRATDEADMGSVSDGYHTFDELYHHRAVLFSVICNAYKNKSWKSKLHDDGTMFDDMFIVGVKTPEGQYTYHYNVDSYWDMFDIQELERAPKWDGHESDDVTRLLSLEQ